MARPTIIDIPHELGREEARRRLREKIGDLPLYVPGGMADVTTNWVDADRLTLTVKKLGQTVPGTIEVQDWLMRVSLDFPPMLSFLSGTLSSTIRRECGALLRDDRSEG